MEELMHTKDQLAEALRGVGLNDMADKAATGYYHDFLSPLDLPEIVLVNQLNIEAIAQENNPERRHAIMALRDRVINGDFDASQEESDDWAASPEGQAAFGNLTSGKQ
jgi:hypothetical protein